MSEKDLIQRCQNGDSAAFAELYDRHIRRIYDFIYYKTHHKQTAEDLTSETFLKALERIGQCDPDRPFGPWLYTIARNTVIDHYRKARPTKDIDDIWDIASGEDIVSDSETRERVAELRELLKELPSVQRDIVILRVWQGLSYKEIAEVVGKSEDNCKVIYSRTLRSLRGNMSPALALFLLLYL